MPFDGTNAPFREPYSPRRSASLRVQRALHGWSPIPNCEREQRLKWKVLKFLRLLGLARHSAGGLGGGL